MFSIPASFFVPEKWRQKPHSHQQVFWCKKLATETCQCERGFRPHTSSDVLLQCLGGVIGVAFSRSSTPIIQLFAVVVYVGRALPWSILLSVVTLCCERCGSMESTRPIFGWLGGRTSVSAGELSLVCTGPAADGEPFIWVNHPL